MKITKEKIIQLFEQPTEIIEGPDSSAFTEDIHEESYSEEDTYILVKFGEEEWSFGFDLYHTWTAVHSGGDGWNEPSYYYAENEETDIQLKDVYDEEGDEFEFDEEVEAMILDFIDKNLF